jgi:hypothetical protein
MKDVDFPEGDLIWSSVRPSPAKQVAEGRA